MGKSSTEIKLDVNLSPEEAISRISSVVDKDRFFSIFRYTGDNQLIGKIKGCRFNVRKKIDYRNSWNPILSGNVKATQTGCEIQAKLEMALFARLLRIIWLGMFVFFISIGLLALFNSLVANTFVPTLLMIIIVPLFLLGFGIGLECWGRKIGKPEGERVRKVFLNLFDDVLIS